MKSKSPATDEVQAAKRIVDEVTARHSDPLPADLEQAWAVWSAGVAEVDARGMALLKAAFEAGAEVAKGKSAHRGKLAGGM